MVLVLGALVSGCVSKIEEVPLTLQPVTTTQAPAEEVGDEIPDVAEVPEEELIQEPDLEINDTIDLGSLL
jgi:hypothetical protein